MSEDKHELEKLEQSGVNADGAEENVSSEPIEEGVPSETLKPDASVSSESSEKKREASSGSHVVKKNRKKKRRGRKIADAILGNPLFWILAIIGALLLFIAFFEHVPQFGVNKVYHIFN